MICYRGYFFVFYIAFIESTGFFLDAIQTGTRVASVAVKTAVATIISNEKGPNTKMEAPMMLSLNELFITEQSIDVPIDASAEHIKAITKDSEKNILNTSFPLAPTARRMPISCRF